PPCPPGDVRVSGRPYCTSDWRTQLSRRSLGLSWDNRPMALPLLNWLYKRLGRHYPGVFLTVELQTAFVIVAGTLGLFTFFYNASTGDYLRTLAVVEGLTVVWVWSTLAR